MILSSISIIIPVLNNLEELQKSLSQLFLQNLDKTIEIIVIDNGSDNKFYEATQYQSVDFLVEKSFRSPYLCRNVGVKKAKGDIIILLDAKCIPSRKLIVEGLKVMEQQKAEIIAGNINFTFSKKQRFSELADALAFFPNKRAVQLGYGVPTGILFIKKEVFEKIGYFLDDVKGGADIEWSKRAMKAGFKIGYAEKAIVYYRACNWKKLLYKAFRDGQGYYDISIRTNEKLSIQWKIGILIYVLPPRPFKLRNRIIEDFDNKKMLQYWVLLWLILWGYKLITFFSILYHWLISRNYRK